MRRKRRVPFPRGIFGNIRTVEWDFLRPTGRDPVIPLMCEPPGRVRRSGSGEPPAGPAAHPLLLKSTVDMPRLTASGFLGDRCVLSTPNRKRQSAHEAVRPSSTAISSVSYRSPSGFCCCDSRSGIWSGSTAMSQNAGPSEFGIPRVLAGCIPHRGVHGKHLLVSVEPETRSLWTLSRAGCLTRTTPWTMPEHGRGFQLPFFPWSLGEMRP